MVARLQIKASQIGKILQNLESKAAAAANNGTSSSGSANSSSHHQRNKSGGIDLGPPVKKPHYIDPIPPFNASKLRKSPSSGNSTTAINSTEPMAILPTTAEQLSDDAPSSDKA